jgi:hypothetical protein
MARPENRSEGRSLSLTLPQWTFDYLASLADHGIFGRTENDVAAFLLIRQADELFEKKIHDRKIPAGPPSREGA